MKKRTILLLFTLLLGLMVTGAVYAQSDSDDSQQDSDSAQQDSAPLQLAQTNTVYDVIAADARLSSFKTLIDAAGLADNFEEDGPFTIFAPSNEAWAAFELMDSQSDATLTHILLYHVLNGSYPAMAVATRDSVPTLLGESVSFTANNGTATLDNDAHFVAADRDASNGVVHIIDKVLIPPIHSLATSPLGSPDQTLAEVLENDGRFETLLMLLDQASLLDELQNPNAKHTLFAPTDEAFNEVPQDVRDEWLAPGNAAFVEIMAYHLVSDELSINQIATDELIPTLEGRPLFVTTDDQLGVWINGTPIESFNVAASNGVIHVIDSVLMP